MGTSSIGYQPAAMDFPFKFIDKNNGRFVKGSKVTDLNNSHELQRNLNAQLSSIFVELPKLEISVRTIAYGIAGIIISGIGLFVLITTLFAPAIGDHFFLDVMKFCFTISSLLMTGLGLYALVQAAINIRPRFLFQQGQLQKLIREGVILDGGVVEIEPEQSAFKIKYRFNTPKGYALISSYITFSNPNVEAGDKVAVLYLNDDIHILL